MLNPVMIQLLASDISSRYTGGELFMLVMAPGADAPRFVPLVMQPWPGASMTLPLRSTPYGQYCDVINDVIGYHRAQGGGKTVISRVKVCDAPEINTDWWCRTIVRLFGSNDNSLRYIANTPHGLWIGATPELLMGYDKRMHRLDTMALAGTRKATWGAVPWDEKNIYENELVCRYIVEQLESIGVTADVQPLDTLIYGHIEHIIRRISAEGVDLGPDSVAELLHPTPALAGYPMPEAMERIRSHESHDRAYYGGLIVIETADRYDAYVNLRCCCIADGRVIAYGGGGITADSVAEDEWEETERKMSAMLVDTIF